MNLSIELKSTMSPKTTLKGKRIKKTPTVLALKKPLRRSLLPQSKPTNDIIVIDSCSSSSCSDNANDNQPEILNKTPLIINDSDNEDENIISSNTLSNNRLSLREANLKRIEKIDSSPQQKNLEICKWLIEITNTETTTTTKRLTLFSELSTISGGSNPGFKKPGVKMAMNSTAQNQLVPRFDQLFRKKSEISTSETDKLSNKERKTGIIEDSLVTTNSVNDSFKLPLLEETLSKSPIEDKVSNPCISMHEETLTKSPLRNKVLSPCISTPSNKDVENLLDSLYGDSWRKDKDKILISSDSKVVTRPHDDNNNNDNIKKNKAVTERKPKRKKSPKRPKNPYLDDESNKPKTLLRTLHENRINEKLTPLIERLHAICDTETESDSPQPSPVAKKLTFDDINDDNVEESIEDDGDDKSDDNWLPVETQKSTTKKGGVFTFLESLSKHVPIDECDASARIFRNHFKKYRNDLTDRLFELYNKEVFDCAIPETTKIEWNTRLTHTAGRCRCKKVTHSDGRIERKVVIELATKVLDSPDRLRDTLIHEMCHAATWIVNQLANGHGEYWKNWAMKAMKTFPELPPIRICHNFALNTKYTYRCKKCSYNFGRHTKSLNIERKRCGYCSGEFEVFINKTTKNGETKSVPVTPKKPPTGFALFVKENYSEFKTSDLKHSDVMKLLGEEFSKMKLKLT